MNLTDIQTAAGAAVIVAILMQVVKPALPKRWVPAVAILVGVVLVVGADLLLGARTGAQLGTAALTGLLGGASSVGLYQVQRGANVRNGGPLMGPKDDAP